jgi:hypothetical protein
MRAASSYTFPLISVLIPFSDLFIVLPREVFPSGTVNKILHAFLVPPSCAAFYVFKNL